jgi:plastocyanin
MGPEPRLADRPRCPTRTSNRRRALHLGALTAAGLALAGCSGTPSASSTTVGGQSASPPQKHVVIDIKNFMFHPDRVTVAPGATVTVTNEDQVAHTLTADDGKFNTGDVQPEKSVTVTAPTTTGTYPYRCSIHQYMTGDLVVAG